MIERFAIRIYNSRARREKYLLGIGFLNDGELALDLIRVAMRIHGINVEHESPVDVVDDLNMSRKEVAEHLDGPLLHSFRKNGVVGVRDAIGGDVPRLIVVQSLHINQESHELRNGDGGVSIVQLEAVLRDQRKP